MKGGTLVPLSCERWYSCSSVRTCDLEASTLVPLSIRTCDLEDGTLVPLSVHTCDVESGSCVSSHL